MDVRFLLNTTFDKGGPAVATLRKHDILLETGPLKQKIN